ncbi:MAG: ABC transporter ATP-binding protein [Acidimicrobiales bacterium]
MSAHLLEARALCCGYGSSVVVRDLDLHVDAGEVVALLGANGAGKTTTLLTLAGSLPALGGEVLLDVEPIQGWPAPRIARRGVSCIPDDRGLFPKLTVRENLQLASRSRRQAGDTLDHFPELRDRRGTPAGLLSGGQQQMLAIARALVREPRLLLIDELSFGLAPIVVQRLLPILRSIADETGAGVLLVEQHVHLGLAIADRAYVLRHGTIALSGTAAQLNDDASLLHESYLGASDQPERTPR